MEVFYMKNFTAEVSETVKFREFTTYGELCYVREVARRYGCKPVDCDSFQFYRFLADIFHYGKIVGVRNEREKKRGIEK